MDNLANIEPITNHLPLRVNTDPRAWSETENPRAFLLVPISLAAALTEIGSLLSIRAMPLCYQSSIAGAASHLFVDVPDFHSEWQHWLRVHQQAVKFVEITPTHAQMRVFIEAGYQINFDLSESLISLSGAALLLRGNGYHLLVSTLPETRAITSMLKPRLELGDQSIGWHALPSINLRLQPRTKPATEVLSSALLLSNHAEIAVLQRWVARAPAPFLSALRIYQDQQRVIVFNRSNEQLPPLACGQLLIEWCRVNNSRLLIPHQMELAPRLPATIVIAALKISADHIALLLSENNETKQLEIANNELTPIRRALFKS